MTNKNYEIRFFGKDGHCYIHDFAGSLQDAWKLAYKQLRDDRGWYRDNGIWEERTATIVNMKTGYPILSLWLAKYSRQISMFDWQTEHLTVVS